LMQVLRFSWHPITHNTMWHHNPDLNLKVYLYI